MPTPTVADLVASLCRLGLLTSVPAQPASDATVFLRQLVEQRALTTYQANRLAQGRTEELVLGPYLVLDRLGEGGRGQVFRFDIGRWSESRR
jgi:hypothetical protein